MMKKKMVVITILTICLMFFSEHIFAAEQETKTEKYIHIVFDNSISMINVKGVSKTDLADATYALQVLLGMLDENDTAVIYPISRFDEKTINNNETKYEIMDSRTMKSGEELRNAITDDVVSPMAENTYFTAVQTALVDLEKKQTDAEKWLVVLSDGEYENWNMEAQKWSSEVLGVNEGVKAAVHNFLKDYVDINIIHYSFKDSGYFKELQEIPKENITYYPNAQSSGDMLNIMIEIGNQIFGRQEVEVDVNNETYSFKIDAPVRKLLVFAQKEEANSNNIQEMELELMPSFEYREEHSLKVETITEMEELERLDNNKDVPEYTYDSICKGNITTYEFGTDSTENNALLPAGEYEIEVTGGEDVTLKVYYEPVVEVGVVFEDIERNGQYVFFQSDNVCEIPNGTYRVHLEVYDPLNTDLEDGRYAALEELSQIRTKMKTNMTIESVGENTGFKETSNSTWQGELSQGRYKVLGKADLFAGLRESIEIEIKVIESLEGITADIIVPDGGINMEKLSAEGNCLELRMYNKGEPLSEEYKEQVTISHVNEKESSYKYTYQETEEGWLLWPEKKSTGSNTNDESCGIKEEIFEINLKTENAQMVPKVLEEKVFYHGEPFAIDFKTSWGEMVSLAEFLFDRLEIELLVNGEKVDWNEVEVQEISPEVWDEGGGFFGLQLITNGKKWSLVKNITIQDILFSKEKRTSEQEIPISVILERYEEQENGEKTVKVNMDISRSEIVIFVGTIAFVIYLIGIWLYKAVKKIYIGRLEGYIEYCKDPVNYMDIEIKKNKLYNLLVPGKTRFKVYLNEIENGDGHYILFSCGIESICIVENMEECLAFSQIRINDFAMKKSNMYDLEQGLKIVVENDPEKTIFVKRK